MGRQKIAIEKIEDRKKRNVAFCKRREGLFKKAETASKMLGAQIGIITFSPAGKPFVFSTSNSPSLDSIIDRFMSASSSSSTPPLLVGNKRNRSSIDKDVDDVHEVSERNHKKQKSNDVIDIPGDEEENDDEMFQSTDDILIGSWLEEQLEEQQSTDVDDVHEISEMNHKKQNTTHFMDATDIPGDEQENDQTDDLLIGSWLEEELQRGIKDDEGDKEEPNKGFQLTDDLIGRWYEQQLEEEKSTADLTGSWLEEQQSTDDLISSWLKGQTEVQQWTDDLMKDCNRGSEMRRLGQSLFGSRESQVWLISS